MYISFLVFLYDESYRKFFITNRLFEYMNDFAKAYDLFYIYVFEKAMEIEMKSDIELTIEHKLTKIDKNSSEFHLVQKTLDSIRKNRIELFNLLRIKKE